MRYFTEGFKVEIGIKNDSPSRAITVKRATHGTDETKIPIYDGKDVISPEM